MKLKSLIHKNVAPNVLEHVTLVQVIEYLNELE